VEGSEGTVEEGEGEEVDCIDEVLLGAAGEEGRGEERGRSAEGQEEGETSRGEARGEEIFGIRLQ
jgi:hypothetical protein